MFSISKSEKEKKKCEVKFGLTSADIEQTEQLAELLKVCAKEEKPNGTWSFLVSSRIMLDMVLAMIKFSVGFCLAIMITRGHQPCKH